MACALAFDGLFKIVSLLTERIHFLPLVFGITFYCSMCEEGKMINLFKIKDQKREESGNATGRAPVKKQSAGELRLHKGLLILICDCSCYEICVLIASVLLIVVRQFFIGHNTLFNVLASYFKY